MNAAIFPSLPLAAYAEGWISGAKVVVFGNALSGLPQRLIERGARHVQVYDPDAARAAEATAAAGSRQLAFAPMEQAGASARDGLFDFALIEDLAGAGAEVSEWLSRLQRVLSRRGVGLIAARNPEAARRLLPSPFPEHEPLGYYELYDALSQHFEEVRMLGQTPFVGYAIADFSAAEEPEVRIDTAFVPGGAEEPEWFLALVSALPVAPEAFSVIQLPLSELDLPLEAEVAAPRAEDTEGQRETEAALREAQDKISRLEAELAAARSELSQGNAQKQGSAQRYESQLASLRAELRKREEWLAGLESRAATADERADEMQSELDQRKAEVVDAQREIDALKQRLEEELRERRTIAEKAEQELVKVKKLADEETRRAKRLEEELRGVRQRVADLTRELEATRERPAPDAEAETELRALEEQLRERATEVARLTQELHDTERFGRQLIAEVNQLKAAAHDEATSRELGRLAQRNAELEADLEAARWTISSLEASMPEDPTLATGAKPAGWSPGDSAAPAPSAPGAD